ncbi:MAG TPA: hypothetical protein DGG94_02930 [Micromonosporaceae bacterium]|nr:hypothetical protein [Micromonosporaceae bacterium]HCU48772.1 hypothetical protein [Micromonosporaceae bacterium]
MDPDDDSGSAQDLLKGLPQVPDGGWGPAGQIDQAAKVASGLRRQRTGWQKAVFQIGLAFLGVLALAVVLFVLVVGMGH